jgi:DNA-binding NarL/FixJ family response regulator
MEHEAELARELRRARLVIVDDHELVRDGLRSMVFREADIEVVGEAANGQEALELCRRIRPDLVLMDVRMPKMDGLQATRAIKQEHPGTSVMMLTIHENADYLLEALKAGAAGYILKESSRREVIAAIRQVLGGETPLAPKLTSQLLRKMASEANSHASQRLRVEDLPEQASGALTPRELEVLRLLAEGLTNPEIASTMMFSVHTVKVHVHRIIAKLGVSDRTQAAVRAIKLGLLSDSA